MRVAGVVICAILLAVLVATPPQAPAQPPVRAGTVVPPDQRTPPYMDSPYLLGVR
jgi:hypothetical protein